MHAKKLKLLLQGPAEISALTIFCESPLTRACGIPNTGPDWSARANLRFVTRSIAALATFSHIAALNCAELHSVAISRPQHWLLPGMGVIKKKNSARATEGGVKFICDVCSIDITSTVRNTKLSAEAIRAHTTPQVRIHCADPACKDYDLCVPCFSHGQTSRDHKPATHSFQVIEQHSVPIFHDEWGADEEALLLEGAEMYGLGSWADIADHIGGFREKDEVRDHYITTYVDSPNFPLPEHASPRDRELVDRYPRETFQANKKRRIEERKDLAKNTTQAQPKQKPTSSVPSCHEVQGYMPGRLEFEVEHLNEAEDAVQHMQFEPGEGYDPTTGELDPEMILKMTVMNIYNSKLNARVDRKKFIFEHELLEYKRNTAIEKKKSKDERDLFNKAKPFARLMTRDDFEVFTKDLEYELNLRQAIGQLQEWRLMQIGDLKSGEKYEHEKAQRAARIATQNSYERFATSKPIKAPTGPETNHTVATLTGAELPLRTPQESQTPHQQSMVNGTGERDKKPLADGTGTANTMSTPVAQRPKFSIQPINNLTPMKLNNENGPDLHLLTTDERDICSHLRIMPKAYNAMKDSVLREAEKHNGLLKKKVVKEICRIDSTKGGKLFDFFVHCGWIARS